jgi:NTP pyrophosphatase (non-canonical NTP hydrolase)
MNEQFSKLLQECIVPANQAVEYSKSKGFVIPDEKLDVAKLALLIVKECAEIADKAEPYKANDLIRKHFGVEE